MMKAGIQSQMHWRWSLLFIFVSVLLVHCQEPVDEGKEIDKLANTTLIEEGNEIAKSVY